MLLPRAVTFAVLQLALVLAPPLARAEAPGPSPSPGPSASPMPSPQPSASPTLPAERTEDTSAWIPTGFAAEVTRMTGPDAAQPCFQYQAEPPQIVLMLEHPDQGEPIWRRIALVRGRIERADATLISTSSLLAKGNGASWLYPLRFPPGESEVETRLTCITFDGKTETAELALKIADPEGIHGFESSLSKRKLLGITLGLGTTVLGYQQTGTTGLVQTGITFKASYTRRLSLAWDIQGSVFTTLFALSATLPTTLRPLGFNIRAGWRLPWFKGRWQVFLSPGLYLTNLYSSAINMGFRNMAGPQITPSFRYTARNGDIWSGYFKFAPVSDALGFYSLNNHEMALGGAFYPEAWTHNPTLPPRGLTLDWAVIHVGTPSNFARAHSISLGVSAGL